MRKGVLRRKKCTSCTKNRVLSRITALVKFTILAGNDDIGIQKTPVKCGPLLIFPKKIDEAKLGATGKGISANLL